MTSFFDDLEAAASAAIGDTFGEVALHTPRVSTQYAERSDDPDRAACSVRGVFSAGQADDRLKGQGRGSDFVGTTMVSSMSAEFWVAAEDVGAMASKPAVGDAITLTNRPGSPIYAISRIDETDRGDLSFILVRESAP